MSIPFPLRKKQRETLLFLRFECPNQYASRGTTRGNRTWGARDASGKKLKIHGHVINFLEERGLVEKSFDAQKTISLMKAHLTEEGRRIAEELRAEKHKAKRRENLHKGRGPGRLSKGWHRRFDKKIIEDYNEGDGKSVAELAHDYNVNARTIRRILRKAEVMEPRRPWPDHVKDFYRTKRMQGESAEDTSPKPKATVRPNRAYNVLSFMHDNSSSKIVRRPGGRVLFEEESVGAAFLNKLIKAEFIEEVYANDEGWKHYGIAEAGSKAVVEARENATFRINLSR